MKRIAAIGLQAGDEGKGKITHYLAVDASRIAASSVPAEKTTKPILVRRYNGGPNAGHTIVHNGVTYAFNHLPAGVCVPHAYSLLGKGMYIEPRRLVQEMHAAKEKGLEISPASMGIDARAQVILQHHTEADRANFEKENHTSTGSGIKQVAIDKYGRTGLRFIEFLDQDLMKKCLERRAREKEGNSVAGLLTPGLLGLGSAYISKKYMEERDFLAPFLVQEEGLEHGKEFWIDEGAQGVMLDIDDGQYPGTTSAHISAVPHAPSGTPLALGVIKLYTSSVGIGDRAFVSRMPESLERKMREAWKEYGTKTGRPRNVGWFDAVAVRYAAEVTGINCLAATSLDRLEALWREQEKVKIVVGYKVKGKVYSVWDVSFHRRDALYEAEPVYEELPSWEKSIVQGKITSNAQRYLDRIQALAGKEIVMIGTGPSLEELAVLREPWKI